jgi:TolB protein
MARFPDPLVARLFGLFLIILSCWAVGFGGWILIGSRSHAPLATPKLLPTVTDSPTVFPSETPVDLHTPTASPRPGPDGKIVYVCQVFRLQAQDQICIINADGTGQRRLTTEDDVRHFYPSLAPDGQSALFSSNLDGNFKIYEQDLASGELTNLGVVGVAPDVSPDSRSIAYARSEGLTSDSIWVMDRDGRNSREVYRDGWDPTWSPDGGRLLFATDVGSVAQLATIALDGSGFHVLTSLQDFRGRSDWSPDGSRIVTYAGKPWQRELILMNADGSDPQQISPPNGDSQGPSFSPDGQWVAFTGYFDHYKQVNGCEIYIMRIDGTDLKRLTNNDYCDWQPRWGN